MISLISDYWQLCKPRVVLLIMITCMVGMLLAVPGLPPLMLFFLANLGIALCAASAAALNHLLDRSLDRKMDRTKTRPVAQQRLGEVAVAIFAGCLALAGFSILYFGVNQLTAYLTLLSLVGYAIVYTAYLKWATPQNIVLGGLSGAMPPLLGWTAITNRIDTYPLILVAIIFVWTPPHFWALALQKKREYAAGGVPILPLVYGDSFTRLHIGLYAILTVLLTFFPYLMGHNGLLYLLGLIPLNLWWGYRVVQLWRRTTPQAPFNLFRHSIHYLAILFLLLLVDHWVGPTARWSMPNLPFPQTSG